MSQVVGVIVGTRPEAIKMSPVVHGLLAAGLETRVITTGQHPVLAPEALNQLGVSVDHALPGPAPGADLAMMLAHVVLGVRDLLIRETDAVLVHGDTTSALGAALAALYLGIPVIHVEAGLRTGDAGAPFPEEQNRRMLDQVAALLLAPTTRARDNLLREGCDPAKIHVTGNPIVDALERTRDQVGPQLCASFEELRGVPLDESRGRWLLVTAHRRETLGAPLARLCESIRTVAERGDNVIWPLHPNPGVSGPVRTLLAGVPRVHLVEPLGYPAFVRLLLRVDLVVTDSGGVQEETAVLGRPTLVIRDVTERPEVLETGVVRLVGTDPKALDRAILAWLDRPPTQIDGSRLIGDGTAGARIGRLVRDWLG